MKQQDLFDQKLEQMVRDAQRRLREWVARSAGQHLRAMRKRALHITEKRGEA